MSVVAKTLTQKEHTVASLGLSNATIIGVMAVPRYFPGNTYYQIDVSSLYTASVGFRVQVCSADYTGSVAYDMYIIYK